jgi:hypothetical protein
MLFSFSCVPGGGRFDAAAQLLIKDYWCHRSAASRIRNDHTVARTDSRAPHQAALGRLDLPVVIALAQPP